MSSPVLICADQFLLRFLTDISNADTARGINILLTFYSRPAYEANAPKNSLNSIANNFSNCIEPRIGAAAAITATQLGIILFSLVVLTVVFVTLIVIILTIMPENKRPEVTIAIIAFFILLYIIVGVLLIHNTYIIINEEITNVQLDTDNCVNNAVTEIDIYFRAQDTAINAALCAYPQI